MHRIFLLLLLTMALDAANFDNKLSFGLKTTAYNYTERDDKDQILDTEDANIFEVNGFYGSFEYKLQEYSAISYYINLYTSISYGDTDYTGSLLGPGASYGSYSSKTSNAFYEFQVNLKRKVQYTKSSTYSMIGIAYKRWQRDLSSNQKERYYYYFLQVVLGGETNIYKDWSLVLDLTGQLAFNPKMDADFKSSTGQVLNETFKLGTVYTYKIATPLVIPINEQLNFNTKLEYEFTSYGKSNTIYVPNFPNTGDTSSYLEPKSQQKNWHLYAGFELIF